jgi:arylsulfatase A-like enzyme
MPPPSSPVAAALVRWPCLVLLACAACTGSSSERFPNVLLVNLDDVRADAIDRMPTLQALAARGMTFDTAVATTPVCAQSRATILTGLTPPHHGLQIFQTGLTAFRESGADRQTLGTWFQAAGYRTALIGKYINGYSEKSEDPDGDGRLLVPPGWDTWRAWRSPERYGGARDADYAVSNDDGSFTWYRDHDSDAEYATDVQEGMLTGAIDAAHADGEPFFVYWAPIAAHAGLDLFPTPAARHRDTLGSLPAHRAASLDAPLDGQPRHVRRAFPAEQIPHMKEATVTTRQRGYESLLAVDEALRDVLDHLQAMGELDRTIVVVTADQGVLWGEHGLYGGFKNVPYQEALRVPLVIAGPGIAHGRVGAPVRMEDVAPTVLELAGVPVPDGLDGRSAAGFARGETVDGWDPVVTLRGWQLFGGDWLRYRGNPPAGTRVRLYHGPTRWGSTPASVVFQFTDATHAAGAGAVGVPRGATAPDSMKALMQAVRKHVPDVRVLHFANDKVSVFSNEPATSAVSWWIDDDASDSVLAPLYGTPHFCGVLTERAKLVTYSTGERELYLLDEDPAELHNRAGDPAVADDEESLLALVRERCV